MGLELVSEPVPESGGFIGFGVTRLLGTPKMDDLVLLVRESVQNSWDARIDQAGGVDYSVDFFALSPAQLKVLREEVLTDLPTDGLDLSSVFEGSAVNAAVVTDMGTRGLNGPTRANEVAASGQKNFVNFIRNIGSPEKGVESGGTYGFGKGSYYRPSAVRTILCHSRVKEGDSNDSRFIVAAVGEPYDGIGLDGAVQPFTGRHFWGVAASGGKLAEPLRGSDADDLAYSLGMGVPEGATGTSIMILGFAPGAAAGSSAVSDGDEDGDSAGETERSLEDAARITAHQLIWQAWPKRLPLDGGAEPMRFKVSYEGVPVEVPSLESSPVVAGFASCLANIRSGSDQAHALLRKSPKLLLGRFSGRVIDVPASGGGFGTESMVDFEIPTHHVARMRAPELVVDYLPFRSLENPSFGWVAVFRSDAALDRIFARSEPPTHDDWISSTFPKKSDERSVVAVSYTRIEEQVNALLKPHIVDPPPGKEMNLGRASASLSKAFATGGYGASKKSGGGGGGGSRAELRFGRPQQRIDVSPDGTALQIVSWEVVVAPGRKVDLRVDVRVASESGIESLAPAGAPQPQIVGWILAGGEASPTFKRRKLVKGEHLQFAVSLFRDAALSFTIYEFVGEASA